MKIYRNYPGFLLLDIFCKSIVSNLRFQNSLFLTVLVRSGTVVRTGALDSAGEGMTTGHSLTKALNMKEY